MKRRPGCVPTAPEGSGVRSAERLARYFASASPVGGGPEGGVESLTGRAWILIRFPEGENDGVCARCAGFISCRYARALDWLRHDLLRARFRPDQDVLRRRIIGCDLLQLAAQEGRLPAEA